MDSLSRVKLLAGAVVLRAFETYRLLLTRFWWLLILFLVNFVVLYFGIIPAYRMFMVLYFLIWFIMYSTIILLSRSSMVCKDWRYVFMSNKTMGIIIAWGCLWVCWSAMLGILVAIISRRGLIPLNVASFQYLVGAGVVIAPFLYVVIPIWIFCLLDNSLLWGNIMYALGNSIYQTMLLCYHSPITILFLYIVALVQLFSNVFGLPSFFAPVLALFYIPLIAVLYEEMRYRTGV